MFLEEINLNFIQPCTTDSKRIRIIATPSKDVSELFPYLNTYLKTAIYNKKGQTLTYNYGPKIIVITKDAFARRFSCAISSSVFVDTASNFLNPVSLPEYASLSSGNEGDEENELNSQN